MDVDGLRLVQIDTYGTETRKYKGKKSQSLQIDKKTAIFLVDLLTSEFKLTGNKA